LKSVIGMIGTEFPRLRIGIGRGNQEWDLSDHVLSKFLADEQPVVERAITRAADAVEAFLSDGVLAAMNRYNAPEVLTDEGKSDHQSEI
jgi:PTH1 family peptidyl-tRNA hydrolase